MFNLEEATLGAELECADIDTWLPIPAGNTYCRKDRTDRNSSGAPYDPLKLFSKYGSEMQARPCHSPEELLEATFYVYSRFPRVSFNYTTNLHVNIRVPGLSKDLKALKK